MSNTPLNDGVADDADAVLLVIITGTFEKTGFVRPRSCRSFPPLH